ncbi:MAG TPA: MBL fold metallo-hydrolase [Thermomicrobiales bacterium]|nr:MBL fold metallo-hydrolase [Thermomicrobiales bacterium]
MAEIKWYGHACFRVRSREATILMDPVPRSLGYKVEKQRADIVTISHDHPGHTYTDMATGTTKLVTGPGEYEMNEVFITGIRTYHDEQNGAEHGRNTAYVLEIEDIVVCHLGDLGHALTESQVESLSSVDVLIVPVGGGPVLDAVKAVEVIAQIDPRIIIPMQYWTASGDTDRDPLERFLKEMGIQEVAPREKLIVRKSDLGETPEVVVLAL